MKKTLRETQTLRARLL